MKSIYLVVPLIGLVVFAGLHRHYAHRYHARVAAEQDLAERAKLEEERKREASRTQALAAAQAASEQRRHDAAEKARREEQQREARTEAEERRSAAITRIATARARHAQLHAEHEQATLAVAAGEQALIALRHEWQRTTEQLGASEDQRRDRERLRLELQTAPRLRKPTLAAITPKRP